MTYIKQNIEQQIETSVFHIKGLIQGVGFRPFIYRIANELDLKGSVHNQNDGVVVYLQGKKEKIKTFEVQLKKNAPPASRILEVTKEIVQHTSYTTFSIHKSKTVDNTITQVSPDIAVCNDCLEDMKQQPHRIDYPFINCTNCGPRFSITKDIPYDRPLTSMKEFEMCSSCRKEYLDVLDRRFHAQPIACRICGPEYTLHLDNLTITDIIRILPAIQKLLNNGKIIAMKGLGGYHLACDAFNREAVQRLRKIKERDGKPFALMFETISALKKYATISHDEEKSITSWQRPIVLVSTKKSDVFPFEIANGLNTLGVFLPYLPFHYLLFQNLKTDALVMTSGNISDCPIITENRDALEVFNQKVDAILTHNRGIVNRVDDSVVQEDVQGIQIIRRARGFTPIPVQLGFIAEGILATGAELSNAFCVGKGKQAIMSQHIGDLKNLETMDFFEKSLDTLKRLFKFNPEKVVCDLHPDYLSTRFAEKLGIPIVYAQHHHAHIAAAMAEFGINEPVIGISYDGTGYGTDGKIWGSEIMVADFSGFERKYHFEYVPIPGGDMVAKEPWRSSLSYVFQCFEGKFSKNMRFLKNIPSTKLNLIVQALESNINTPESCSAGRLFDAVAGLSNICSHASYHAEGPIRLEHSIDHSITDTYPVYLHPVISWRETIRCILVDMENGVLPGIISAKFHNTIVKVTTDAIYQISKETGIKKVILSGGTFQNKFLTKKVLVLLNKMKLEAYIAREVPCNDGGIALGQLAIAAKSK